MLSLFKLKPALGSGAPSTPRIDLSQPASAGSLLNTPRRRRLLEHIWQRTSLSRHQFAALCLAPIERYAELVQQFPASESHHHAYPGGMLDHALEVVAYALKLRQSHLLPAGAAPELQAAQSEAWTAAVMYAALLHDIGKIAVDLHVELADGTLWRPWHGPMRAPYRFRYAKDREYRLHGAATGLLYTRVLNATILDWMSSFAELWAPLLYVLAGQFEHAGVLGELVTQADQASVAQALGGDPTRAMVAPRHALPRKLLDGLRYLLREELKLNQPQASDAWLTQEALWLVSKTVSDKLRAHLLSQGVDGIPASNTTLFTVMQDHGLIQATPEGKAIWKATVTSHTGWSHSFTLLRISPSLIWERNDVPPAFAGTVQVTSAESISPIDPLPEGSDASASTMVAGAPGFTASPDRTEGGARQRTDAVDDLLSLFDSAPASPPMKDTAPPSVEPAITMIVPPSAPPEIHELDAGSGEHFLAWLKQRIQSRKLIINDAKALVHTVSDTAYLVSPGVFQRYVQEHPQIQVLAKQDDLPDWRWIQKRFEKRQAHRRQPNGLNIWTCEIAGPRKSKRLHGYLLNDPALIFDTVPPNNPYLSVASTDSAELS